MNCASRCAPRARGPLSRPVAMSLAREDYATMPRWRARARIVPFFSRERPVQTRKPSVTSGSGRGFCLAQARAQEVKRPPTHRFLPRTALAVSSSFYHPLQRYQQHALAGGGSGLWGSSCRPSACGRRSGPVPVAYGLHGRWRGRIVRSSAPAGSCLSAMGGAAAPGACAAWAARARLWERASTPREDPAPPSTTAPAPLVRRVVLPTHRGR